MLETYNRPPESIKAELAYRRWVLIDARTPSGSRTRWWHRRHNAA